MRHFLFAIFLCAPFYFANAQEQEQKLLDRLLKPDMSLQNNAQGKQFTASGATETRKIPTKSFFVANRKAEKGFWNTRQVASREFATDNASDSHKVANLSTRTKIANAETSYATSTYGDIRTARDAKKSVSTSDYSGNRPFLVKGKSQKALSQQDRPLTIDEVRELLNKNK